MADISYYRITKKDLYDLFARLSQDYSIFVPYAKGESLYFGPFNPDMQDQIELGGIRQSQPFKSFLSRAREGVVNPKIKEGKPVIVAGVKGCDLKSLTLQDFVFLEGDFKDPYYAKNREKTLIIGNDCTYARETCFCLAMDCAPYPERYFDINLSRIDDYFLAEVGSDKGRAIINTFKTFFKSADRADDIKKRDANRNKVSDEVRGFIEKRGTPDTSKVKGAVKRHYSDIQLWQDFASTCVECGACNLVCPTCHCFLLFDAREQAGTRRFKVWDACLYNTFARVAGGANPRRHLYERLRNRFDKKFDFFPQVLDYFACTGCGRCIEACPGDIDLREVLKGVVSGKWSKPPHE